MTAVPDRSVFENAYAGKAPWDIGKPQRTLAAVADRVTGPILDAGCGTGEHALLAAAHGANAAGMDISPRAIGRAREKAAERGLTARFEVADALDLGPLGLTFDTVIDSGLFHVFDDPDRARYVTSLAAALEPGGTCYLMCFSDRQPGDFGPRRVSRDELTEAFGGDGWAVDAITADTFGVSAQLGSIAQAWLATIRRT